MTTLTPATDDVVYLAKAKIDDERITARILMERAVVRHAATALIAAGFEVRLHDGEDYATERTKDVNLVMRELMATDEEQLRAYAPTGEFRGAIQLIYPADCSRSH
ncbi:hypothetical protein [Variovorax sp. LT1R16]|uniref:hypothetical protein n=1 Tax=Variovorax sp. LT1R16 TaxID=3443728 RepID=UPI003F461DB7